MTLEELLFDRRTDGPDDRQNVIIIAHPKHSSGAHPEHSFLISP